MVTFISQTSILLLLFFYATTFNTSMSNNLRKVRCNEKDRRALLMFKQGVVRDPLNVLATWFSEKDCCAWKGVQCDNITSRVTKLDLSEQSLEGEINLSLLEIEFLNHLDLSLNYFNVVSIPPTHNEVISDSNLQHLDLFGNEDISMDNLHWLSQLSSLKYLNFGHINIQKVTSWLQLLAMLPSLSELHLSYCGLNNTSPTPKHVNFTSLVTLNLSFNNFNSKLPHWLLNLSNDISYLYLSWSNLYGEIPSSFFNYQNLKYLDLSYNLFSGSIPSTLGNLTSLVSLWIESNSFSGSIPSTLGNLTSLVFLSIGSNSFSGVVSESHFSRLSNLEHFYSSNSKFSFHFNPKWIPPFQLKRLFLANTIQGPEFPPWIYTQKSLSSLGMSRSGISFVDKERFRSLIAGNYLLLDMSNNSISEDISTVMLNSTNIKLQYNNFTGRLPHLSPKVIYVDLSHNSFTGSVPCGWKNLKHLLYINLWSNKLFGEVLVELSNLTQLIVMNLGKNEFWGSIPVNMSQLLQVVILRSNQFEGSIPPQLFNLSSLIHLDLAHNKLSGSIPQVVYNTTEMIVYHDYITFYVIDDIINFFTKGQVYEYNLHKHRRTIDLSANNLSGEIPSKLFGLIQLQTLNLSYNNLIGTIPKTIEGMKNLESLDLSNNKLFGEIPQNMATLPFLSYLNLSCNNFTGQIPTGTQLQSFDASSYIGNLELCGAPLTKCSIEEKDPTNAMQHIGNEDGDSEKESLYLGMGVGFAVGFWGICGSLLLFRKWRHAYYCFLERVIDQLYVTYMVKSNRYLNKEAPAN